MKNYKIPTSNSVYEDLTKLESEECYGVVNFEGWKIIICKHKEWNQNPDQYMPSTFSIAISAKSADISWINKNSTKIFSLFEKHIIPNERRDREWQGTTSRDIIENELIYKWKVEWFKHKERDLEVEWGKELKISECLVNFLNDLREIYLESETIQ